MASLNYYSRMIAFFTVSLVFVARGTMQEEGLSLPPLPGNVKTFLDDCGAKLTRECGDEVNGALYKDGTVSDYCCIKLVGIGRACHDAFTQVTMPFYPKLNKSQVLARSKAVWDGCVAVAGGRAPRPN